MTPSLGGCPRPNGQAPSPAFWGPALPDPPQTHICSFDRAGRRALRRDDSSGYLGSLDARSTARTMPSHAAQIARPKRGRGILPRRYRHALAVAAATLPLLTFAACGSSRPVAAKARGQQSSARELPATVKHPTTTEATATPTTAPPTTAPSTTAPPTTAPSTTAPPAAPPTTVPPTTAPPITTSTPSTPLPSLAPAAPGLVAGHVTAVGDSVMLDYQADLQTDVPGIDVEAAVSRQWADGEEVLQQLRAEGRLGAVVVVALGTNGPITDADFNAMMTILAGASRVVFVTIVVDKPWQDPNNEVLRGGVARYANTTIADWYTLESQHPEWVYSDGTHLPIGGAGAQALAALVASEV